MLSTLEYTSEPAQIKNCYAGLIWMIRYACRLGVDTVMTRVGVFVRRGINENDPIGIKRVGR